MKAASAAKRAGAPLVTTLARQLQSFSTSMLGNVRNATDLAFTLAQSRIHRSGTKAAVAKGAALLRDQRQAAGLTLDDLGRALEVDDPSFMGLVEAGKVGLPLELILRLTAVLGRKDPVGFALQMTRVQPEDVEGAGGAQRGPTAGPGRARTRVRQHRQKPRWGRARSDADFAAALSFADAAFATALTSRPSGRRVRIEAPARRKAR